MSIYQVDITVHSNEDYKMPVASTYLLLINRWVFCLLYTEGRTLTQSLFLALDAVGKSQNPWHILTANSRTKRALDLVTETVTGHTASSLAALHKTGTTLRIKGYCKGFPARQLAHRYAHVHSIANKNERRRIADRNVCTRVCAHSFWHQTGYLRNDLAHSQC